jgi:hypothetical protein
MNMKNTNALFFTIAGWLALNAVACKSDFSAGIDNGNKRDSGVGTDQDAIVPDAPGSGAGGNPDGPTPTPDTAGTALDAPASTDAAAGRDGTGSADAARDGTLASADVLPDAALPKADAGDAGRFCTWRGKQIADGELAYYDNCNGCYCSASGASGGGIWCTSSGCPAPDAGLYRCSLATFLTYGLLGGRVVYSDSSTVDTSAWTYTHKRTYPDATLALTCEMPLMPCYAVSGMVMNRLAADLAAAEVTAAFTLAQAPLFGRDMRPMDGPIFSVVRSDGHGILVGNPCPTPSTDSCTAIPASVQALVDDLESLDRQMLELNPSLPAQCAAFNP